jgi:hypothetical protein
MSEHKHAPCIKDEDMFHIIVNRGDVFSSQIVDRLHDTEGCGDCPNSRALGKCAVLNSIGAGKLSETQRNAFINMIA